ncbi:MAG: hypothetical protein H0V81_08915 [Solirubrobacterales bacterium]|nr:hypothetical protein [Solirubrobacterales bacterium]
MNFRTPAALFATAALALGATACGDDEETTGGGGDAAAEPVAQVDNLTGVDTAVTLDPGFVQALTDLKVTPGPVGDAEISADGVASFPITGGNVKYFTPGTVSPFVQGIINHDGSGLSLEAGGKKVELENFDVDPGASILTGDVSVDGEEAAADAPLFFLDGRTLNPLQANDDGTAVLEGTTVVLTQTAADLLNQTFGIDALTNEVVIGTAAITINTQ